MDLSSILGNLTEDDLSQLKQTAEALFSGEGKDSGPPSPPVDLQLMEGIAKLGRAMSQPDEKTDLLRALRPFLSEERQKRTDEALSFLRIYNALIVFREGGGRLG